MNMKKIWIPFCLLLLFFAHACAKKAITVIDGQGHDAVPVVFDVDYDPILDNYVPGYKMLTVAVRNRGYEPYVLDPVNDKWTVVDVSGRKHMAFASLRTKDAQVWAGLKPQVRAKLTYPIVVPRHVTQTFDIYIPSNVDLANFRSIYYKSVFLNKRIKIVHTPSGL